MKTIKLAIIGGGSSYTPELMEGLIRRHHELPVSEICLVDIEDGRHKLDIIAGLTERMIAKAGLDIKVNATVDRREAIRGADFVLTQFRVGGLAARARDERIPLKYRALGQETTGAGGFAKAMRTIPVILEICRDIEELAPNALLINFTNPAGMVTEAVSKYTNVKVMGLCNVPINMHYSIARMLGVKPEEAYLEFAGLNHMVWVHRVTVGQEDKTGQVLDMLGNGASLNMNNIAEEPWDPELLKAIGVIPCPYHRYFYMQQAMLEEELEAAESGGTRAEQVMKTEEELFKLYASPELNEKPKQLEKRGGAYYSEVSLQLIDAIWNDRKSVQVVNTRNNGAIRNLPDDAVVEINAVIDANGAHAVSFGTMPPQLASLLQSVKAYESLAVEAAVEGDYTKAIAALALNPMVPDMAVAKQLLDDIIEQNAAYLPQFKRG
ncbi:6-phospho-beta-glucosidase [Parendozoicomonas haliclonae]|uniref:Putative 6-phospho-beta-glucosidase n=1 Tax=Parendozoicomonas haliclonae TaxID=1960125 RepID=A0A1X7ANN7_9GAMM|nr:6-phospho-beta-glucosidase [Parendozoicomonas haliclonae]SMA49914.1 putative 6-phospho-beta-glucosidase [Parendozoicomonas haliclonae]